MELLQTIIKTLEDLKVKDLAVYDFEKSSPFYDYFIIATVNERQGNAVVNHLKKAIKSEDLRHIEGKGGTWVLIDCNSVIVHLFSEEERNYFGLDKRLIEVKRII